ncbi:MAG: glycosyltransferase family 2 protein [Actinomycetes bacterium]
MGSRISVVMISHNRRPAVVQTLAHLTALPEQPPVLLVDNGSTDGTGEAVRAAFPQVQMLRQERNLGAVGRNVGVAAAETPYVAFADDDSWWAPGALDRAVAHFDATPSMAVLAGRILVGPDQRLDPVCELMRHSPLPRDPELPGPQVLGFVACGAVVRRRAFLDVGGFSPVIGFLGEEDVLSQDLRAAGWSLVYADDVVAHHHPASDGPRTGRARLQKRNALLSVWLRRPWPVVLGRTARAATRVTDADERGALADALRRLPFAVRDRQVLPDHVEAEVRLLERAGR